MTSRTIGIEARLNELASQIKDESRDPYSSKDGEITFNGEYLAGEGYERVRWPGTANVTNYMLYQDGVLKINIFMGEESAHVRETQFFTIPEFAKYIDGKKIQEEVEKNIQEMKGGSAK